MSYEKRLEELEGIVGTTPTSHPCDLMPSGLVPLDIAEADYTALLAYIAEQVEQAYIAGSLMFNALSHEVRPPLLNPPSVKWADLAREFSVTGPDSILPSIYLQSKGFKK